jgi:hypothetical protein
LFTLSKFPPYSSSALYKFHCNCNSGRWKKTRNPINPRRILLTQWHIEKSAGLAGNSNRPWPHGNTNVNGQFVMELQILLQKGNTWSRRSYKCVKLPEVQQSCVSVTSAVCARLSLQESQAWLKELFCTAHCAATL